MLTLFAGNWSPRIREENNTAAESHATSTTKERGPKKDHR